MAHTKNGPHCTDPRSLYGALRSLEAEVQVPMNTICIERCSKRQEQGCGDSHVVHAICTRRQVVGELAVPELPFIGGGATLE